MTDVVKFKFCQQNSRNNEQIGIDWMKTNSVAKYSSGYFFSKKKQHKWEVTRIKINCIGTGQMGNNRMGIDFH